MDGNCDPQAPSPALNCWFSDSTADISISVSKAPIPRYLQFQPMVCVGIVALDHTHSQSWTDQYWDQRGRGMGVHWPTKPRAELKDTELQLSTSSLSNTGKGTLPIRNGKSNFPSSF